MCHQPDRLGALKRQKKNCRAPREAVAFRVKISCGLASRGLVQGERKAAERGGSPHDSWPPRCKFDRGNRLYCTKIPVALVHPKVGLNEPMEQRPCRERLMPCPLWNRRTRVARLSRGSDRRGLPHGKEGGLRDYSCTHRDGEGKGRKIFQDPKHDHFSLIST